MPHYETLLLDEPAPHILQITLNRPEFSNAMNTQMGLDMLALFDGFCANPSAYRCLLLTGAGERAFCAGGDLKQRLGMTDEQWQAQHLVFERQVRAMLACRLLPEALETAARIAGNAPLSTHQIKHAVNTGLQMDLASALLFEIEAYNRLVPTEDRREGVAAFNEKRRPVFRGR